MSNQYNSISQSDGLNSELGEAYAAFDEDSMFLDPAADLRSLDKPINSQD